jgi:hypothetical protein
MRDKPAPLVTTLTTDLSGQAFRVSNRPAGTPARGGEMAKKKALGKEAMKTTRGGYQTGGSGGRGSKVTSGGKVTGTGKNPSNKIIVVC